MSTEIMNMALDLLDEEPILSASDNRTVVRWMNRNFDAVRDSLLRAHPWNFAKRRAALPAREAAPLFGFAHAFPKPTDCLRVLPLADLGMRGGAPTDFVVEGPDILTNAPAPLNVLYIARITDDTAFDPVFVQYLTASLAARAANYVTGKQSYAERLGQIAADLKGAAVAANVVEGTTEQSGGIINMALDLLAEPPLDLVNETREGVRWMVRNLAPTRDAALRLHPWNFAKRRATLTALGTAPTFGFASAFALPADCLRVLPLEDLGARNGRRVDFAVENGQILTGSASSISVQYIARVTDEAAMDPLFKQFLAATLAMKAAGFITGKAAFGQMAAQVAADARASAQVVNALEGTPEESFDDDWVGGRTTGVVEPVTWR